MKQMDHIVNNLFLLDLDSVKSEITQTLEPLIIIPSKDGGPYAYQTKLGWCIVGPMQNVEHQNSLLHQLMHQLANYQGIIFLLKMLVKI